MQVIQKTTLLLSIVLSACSSQAEPLDGNASYVHDDAIEKARNVIAWATDNDIAPGFRVTVAQDDAIIFDHSSGYADLDNTPLGPQHRFRVYSIAKSFTAVAALSLVEEGKLDLDVPIETYLPALPSHLQGLTTRQLLQHVSGIRHYRDGEWFSVSNRQCDNVSEALNDFIDDPLVSETDGPYSYSSFGYVLASAVIEAASGERFEDYMQGAVFDPAGMEATALEGRHMEDSFSVSEHFHRPDEGWEAVPEELNASCKFGGGGFVSTTEDLIRFGNALIDERLVSRTSLQEAWTMRSQWDLSIGQPAYGMGFSEGFPPLPSELPEGYPEFLAPLFELTRGLDLGMPIHNNGSAAGAFAMLILYPETDTVLAFTSNARTDFGEPVSVIMAASFGVPQDNNE